MRFRSAQPHLVILILTCYLLSLGGMPGASVLCYGSDGHVAIEPAGKHCASPSGDEVSHFAWGPGVATASGVPCVDVPVSVKTDSVPRSRSSNERSPLANAIVSAVLLSHMDISASTVRMLPLYCVPAPASDSLAALRTIILLV